MRFGYLGIPSLARTPGRATTFCGGAENDCFVIAFFAEFDPVEYNFDDDGASFDVVFIIVLIIIACFLSTFFPPLVVVVVVIIFKQYEFAGKTPWEVPPLSSNKGAMLEAYVRNSESCLIKESYGKFGEMDPETRAEWKAIECSQGLVKPVKE